MSGILSRWKVGVDFGTVQRFSRPFEESVAAQKCK